MRTAAGEAARCGAPPRRSRPPRARPPRGRSRATGGRRRRLASRRPRGRPALERAIRASCRSRRGRSETAASDRIGPSERRSSRAPRSPAGGRSSSARCRSCLRAAGSLRRAPAATSRSRDSPTTRKRWNVDVTRSTAGRKSSRRMMSPLIRHQSGFCATVSTRAKALSRRGVPRSLRARFADVVDACIACRFLHSVLIAEEDDLNERTKRTPTLDRVSLDVADVTLERLGDCEQSQHRGRH